MTQNAQIFKGLVNVMGKDCFLNAYVLNLEGKYLNSAFFSVIFIAKYFYFSASAGGFDLSLFNMHSISGASVSN